MYEMQHKQRKTVGVQLGHCWGTVRTQLGTVGGRGTFGGRDTVGGRGTVGAKSQLGLKFIQVY